MKMNSTIKYLMIIFTMLILSLFMIGCQEDSTKIDTIQTMTNEDVISNQYYEEVKEYSKQLEIYMNEFNMYIRNKEMDSDNAISLYKDGIIFASENMNLNPKTKADKVLDEYIFNVNYYFKQSFDNTLQAVATRDMSYATLGEEALNSYNKEISIVREILEKYEVNN